MAAVRPLARCRRQRCAAARGIPAFAQGVAIELADSCDWFLPPLGGKVRMGGHYEAQAPILAFPRFAGEGTLYVREGFHDYLLGPFICGGTISASGKTS